MDLAPLWFIVADGWHAATSDGTAISGKKDCRSVGSCRPISSVRIKDFCVLAITS